MKITEQSKSQINHTAEPRQTHQLNKLIGMKKWRGLLAGLVAAVGLVISFSASAQIINVDYVCDISSHGPSSPLTVYTGQGVLGGPSDTYWNGYYASTNITTNGLSGLLDSQGNSTSVGVVMSIAGSSYADSTGNGGAGNLLADYYYFGGGVSSNTVTITGLVSTNTYTLICYSSGNANGQGGIFSGALTGTTTGASRSSFIQGVNYVENTLAAPDTNGTITFVISPSSGGYAIFNGLQIQANTVNIIVPSITNEPASQIVRPGQTATFSVGASLGSQIPYFQWYFNGNPITNATGETLSLNNVSANQAGSYTVVITNASGSATSAPPATLTVDTTTTTSIVVGGDQGQGLDLQGTTNEIAEYYAPSDLGPLTIQNVTFTNNDDRFTSTVYPGTGAVAANFGDDVNDTNLSLIANNDAESDSTYDPITLAIPTVLGENYKLQLIFHDYYNTSPSKQQLSVQIGSEVVEPALDVAGLGAGGSNPKCVVISYFFTGDGNSLPLTISNILALGFGQINALTLQVLPGSPQIPYFVTSPISQTTVQGSPVNFSALAGGSAPPFSYQWYFGTDLIVGATNTVFSIPYVVLTNAGIYSVVASDSAGSATNSATLSVNNNVNLTLSTGPTPGQGMNLEGNIVLAEYYYNPITALQNVLIGGALFVPSTRAGNSGQYLTGTSPNFGSSSDQVSLGQISSYSIVTTNFTFPTTAGDSYDLQLILHEGYFTTVNQRVFGMEAISSLGVTNVLAANLDLVAQGAYSSKATNVVISFVFTGDGGPMTIQSSATVNSPCISALVLQDLTAAVAPTFLTPLGTKGAYSGDTVSIESHVNGSSLAYQWQQEANGVYSNISGATNYSLTITNISLAGFTNYVLVVTNSAGSLTATGAVEYLAFNPHALIGHWLSGSQSLADSSGYAPAGTHDGVIATGSGATLNNGPAWSSDVPSGFSGSSLDLPDMAGSTFMMISNTAISDVNYWPTFDRSMSNGYSITIWAEGFPTGSYGTLVAKRGESNSNGTNGYQFRKNSSNAQIRSDRYRYVNGVPTGLTEYSWLWYINAYVPTNVITWHHYAVTWDAASGVQKMYIDNILVVSIIGDTNLLTPASSFHLGIGARQDGSAWGNFIGASRLYDARIYGYALSAAQIQAINQEPTPNPYQVVTGPGIGQGLDLQENFVISEYYGPTYTNTYYMGGVAFTNDNSRIAGTGTQASQQKPNFGTSSDQQVLANLSSQCKTAANMAFALTNLNVGDTYKLQLLFHENFYSNAGSRQYLVNIGLPPIGTLMFGTNMLTVYSNNPAQYALQYMLDLAAVGANTTNPVDFVLPYTFTATSAGLQIAMTNLANTPMLSALTLADLSTPVTIPVVLVPVNNVTTNEGATAQLIANVAGAQVTYQWQKLVNGVYENLTDGGNISGSTNNVLTITSLGSADSTSYQIVVTNSAGSASSIGSVTVIIPAPTLVIGPVTDGQFTITLSAGAALESTTNLNGGTWIMESTGTNSPITIIPASSGNKFYRAVTTQ